ncbi:protein of unknown function [Xenorhabdus bovienii]|uniref:Uncharacterized protein n=1 Tax=Xenorhabdus bovienii TaxID=40576 RepID=A0A0B6XG23_XENBV|nr:protein of unknown function [Xenorhabdus bovienii]
MLCEDQGSIGSKEDLFGTYYWIYPVNNKDNSMVRKLNVNFSSFPDLNFLYG